MKKIISTILSCFLIYSFVCVDIVNAMVMPSQIPISINKDLQTNTGKIIDTFLPNSKSPQIVFIQDLHTSTSVQKNISEILTNLDKEYGIDTILLEGIPSGNNDTYVLKDLNKLNISDSLLSSNVLTGPEYFLINNKTNAKVYGLENWETYIENIKRAAQIIQDKEYITETYEEFKNSLYSKNENFKKLEKYINFDLSDDKLLPTINQPILQYSDLHKYISICNNMQKINKDKLNREFLDFKNELKNNLDFKNYSSLISLSKKEDLTEYYKVFYTYLLSKEQYIKKYNELYTFFNNITEKQKINLVSLISQENEFFNNYLSSVINNKTKQDMFVLKMTYLLKDFLQISISDENYSFFINNYENFLNLLPKYLEQEYYDYQDLLYYDLIFDYHKTNKDRNKDFITNIVNSLNKKTDKNKIIVVVAGGFHTSISKTLKEQNIPYIFVTPTMIGKADTSFYNAIISSTNTDALAPIKIMLSNTKLLSSETISVFFENLINSLAKENNFAPEIVKNTILSILNKSKDNQNLLFGNIPFSIKTSNSNFIINIDGQELKFKIEKGNISWEKRSVNYHNYINKEKKGTFIDNLIITIKKKFGIFQATSMKLNPESKYSSRFFSKRLDKRGRLLFTLSMVFSALHLYDFSYSLMMGFAYFNKNNVSTYTINFDDKVFEELKDKPEFNAFINKKITILLEQGLEQDLKEEDLKEMLKEAIKRVDVPVETFKDTLFVGFLDKSTNLFEDNLNNGFIGVNSGILEIKDVFVKKALLKTGIIHEISHELKGSLSKENYSKFERKIMYDDIKYIIDFIAKNQYKSEKNKPLNKDLIEKIKSQIINSFEIVENGKKTNLFSHKNRFIKKIANYKYSIADMIEMVVKKDISNEHRRDVELKHLEECLSPEDSSDKESIEHAKDLQQEFFSNLRDKQKKQVTVTEFIKTKIAKERIEEINEKRHSLNKRYIELLNLIYPDEIEDTIKISYEELNTIKKIPKDELRSLKDLLGIKNKPSKVESKKILELHKFIQSFDSCIEAMYKVMPSWMFEAFYNDKGIIVDHSLNHSIEILNIAMRIIALDFNQEIDIKTLIYSALLHDVSCTIFRQNHEQNSSTWARTILKNGANLTKEEIDKICIVALNHKKYKKPLKGEEDLKEAHIKYYEAGLLHDADGLSATLDLNRILGIWLTHKDPIINKAISVKNIVKNSKIKDRVTLIKDDLYLKFIGGDAINDLMRQFYRRNPDFYITKGAKELANAAFQDNYALIKFIDSSKIREQLKSIGHLSDRDIDYALKIINDTFSTDNLIPGYVPKNIEEIREDLILERGYSNQGSKFNLFYKLKTLFKIVFNLPVESNIVLSDIHGGYDRLAEILVKSLDSSYNLDEILKIFNYTELTNSLSEKIKSLDSSYNLDKILNIFYPNHNSSNYTLDEILKIFNYEELAESLTEEEKSNIEKIRNILGNNMINLYVELANSLTEEEKNNVEETRKKLNKDIINLIKITKKNIYVLGDMNDRGNRQIESFDLLNQISKTGKLKYIAGNHDIYAFMNLLGLHLPFYDNYKGISDDYVVKLTDEKGTEKEIKVLDMLKSYKETGTYENKEISEEKKEKIKARAKDKTYWAEKLYEYMQAADTEQKKWTKNKNEEGLTREQELQNLFEDTFGFKLDSKGKDVLNKPSGIFDKDKELLNFHKNFFGRNVGVVVYTGIRAVNKMSINWWLDRQKELNSLMNKKEYKQYSDYYKKIQEIIDKIIEDQQKTLNEKYMSEDWEWIVIDSIMYRNYESTEWNALDWIYHKGWGGEKDGFLKQLNDKISREIEIEKQEKIKLIQNNSLLSPAKKEEEIKRINESFDKKSEINRVTPVTYFNNPIIQELLKFYQNNFYLYREDHLGNSYMHALLPVDKYNKGYVSLGYVDKDGKFKEIDSKGHRQKGFIYKGKLYKKASVIDGLEKIASDIRSYDINSNNLSKVMEAFTLLTAIYADNTTKIKSENLKDIKEEFDGFSSVLENMGISTLLSGHIPISKLGHRVETEKVGFFNKELDIQKVTLINADGEMSPGYKKPFGAGVGIEFSILEGVKYRGFLSGTSETFSSDRTPDVSVKDTKATIILNLFPSLRKILSFTVKMYKFFINMIPYTIGKFVTKGNTTFVTITTQYQLKEIEETTLRKLSTIAIVPNELTTFAQKDEIDKSFITINDTKIQFNVYLNKILAGNGKYMKVLSYEYQKTEETEKISKEKIEFEINKFILEQIKHKKYKKQGIKTLRHILTDFNTFGESTKTISDDFKKAMEKSFGVLPILYDMNLPNNTDDLQDLTTEINIDKIKDVLSAA